MLMALPKTTHLARLALWDLSLTSALYHIVRGDMRGDVWTS